jgi:peptide chain release factor 3
MIFKVYNLWEQNINLFSGDNRKISRKQLLFGCSKSRIRKIIGQKPADTLREELELIDEVYPKFDRQDYLDGKLQPVFWFCLK